MNPRPFEWGEGPVGDAVRASEAGRIRRFIRDGESEAAALFSPAAREVSDTGDWYGEHVGKWLIAAGGAWERTQDAEIADAISKVVRHLVDSQEANGYLGTYSSDAKCRLTHPEAKGTRTWDVWVHAWAILGLLAVTNVPGVEGAMTAAVRVGDLILATFPAIHASVLDLGNHAGLSSSVILEPLAKLTEATGDLRYVELASATIEQMEARGLYVLSAAERNLDVAEIGTGKAYQICWTLVGMVAVYRVTGDIRLLTSVASLWDNIRDEHLTPMGGPWGGIAGHKEVFNARGFFSPHGMVETCSASSWMSLCKALYEVTGRERYIAAYEQTLMNTILGALDKTGQDWCYFTFPNGRRNNTYHWACCKSSGAMALEEAASMAITSQHGQIMVNLLVSCRVETGKMVLQLQSTAEAFTIRVESPPADETELLIRIPDWAKLKSLRIDGKDRDICVQDGYLQGIKIAKSVPLDAHGARALSPLGEPDPQSGALASSPALSQVSVSDPGDRTRTESPEPQADRASALPNDSEGSHIELTFDCPTKVHPMTFTVDHHGQEVVRMDYAYVSKGPYVYATGLIDGYKKEETLRLARLTPEAPFRPASRGRHAPALDLHLPGREAIRFLPYHEAGGRHDGAWRTTWLQVAWQ